MLGVLSLDTLEHLEVSEIPWVWERGEGLETEGGEPGSRKGSIRFRLRAHTSPALSFWTPRGVVRMD